MPIRPIRWFLSSTNTDEHQKMVKSQTLLYYKLKSLRGDPLPEDMPQNEKRRVQLMSVERAVTDARDNTYNYVRLKSNNGRDRSFIHDVGRDRFRSSLTSLDSIDDFSSAFGIIPPAEHVINETRNNIFVHAGNKEWLRRNIENCTAKLIYASTVDHKELSPAAQHKALNGFALNKGIEAIKNSPMFRKLMQTYSADDIATAAMKGGGALTDKLITAQNAVDHNREEARKPKNMTEEARHEFLKNISPVNQ